VAFVALFAHFGSRLKTYFRRLGMVDEEAEELAQEAMLFVWRKAPLSDPGKAAASTWIYAIARNLRLDALRRGNISRNKFPALKRWIDQESAPSPEEQFASSAQQACVRKAIQLLSREQSEAIRLCYFAGRSHTEVARELGVPLGTVKGRLRLVLGRLRRALANGA
jgi:RNA polymerase sigma-70 factor (ECF subfamily)